MHHPSFVGESKGHRGVRYLCCFAYGRLKTRRIQVPRNLEYPRYVETNSIVLTNLYVRLTKPNVGVCETSTLSYYP